MSAPRHDRGLHAVARVRGVREHDARHGLQLALAELRTSEERVHVLAARLGGAGGDLDGEPGLIVSRRLGLAHLGEALRAAEAEAAAQRLVAEDARGRWQAAATELAAVEQLLDRRAPRRRAAAAKAEARELDDLAAVRFAAAHAGVA